MGTALDLPSIMDLTEQQVRAIRQWAMQARHVREVRLFGSRAKGGARPNADVDLALTVGGDNPGTILGIYYALGQRWQDELTSVLGLKAHVNLYNHPADPTVRAHCDEGSFVLVAFKPLAPS
jgi:predicted nucleotidyltransferase